MATFNESGQETVSTPTNDMVITDKSTTINDSEITKKDIESLGNKIRLTDKDENMGLELYCYVQCNNNDNNIIRQCRGVVFNEDKLVMKAFPYTMELVHTDENLIREHLSTIIGQCSFYSSYEGTLIRLFYFGQRWFTSTHRKLNAFRSKWASRESFGTCFKRCLESLYDNNEKFRQRIPDGEENLLDRFQETLDKNKQYMFLVTPTEENRIVCSVSSPKLFHVGTFIDGNLNMDINIDIPYPEKYNFSTVDELIAHVNGIDIHHHQGVICFAPNNLQYKIIHKDYNSFFRARGNEPSIKFRYLQTRLNRRVVDMLFHLYPNMENVFDEIENYIYDVAKNIYHAYVQRYIKKKFVTAPTEEFNVIKECHKWHELDRVNNRITLDKVIEVLNQQAPTALNRMIRRFRTENNDNKANKQGMNERLRSITITSENDAPNTEVPMEE
jgi:hypothetical protein